MRRLLLLLACMIFISGHIFSNDGLIKGKDIYDNPYNDDIYIPPDVIYSLEDIFSNIGEPINITEEVLDNPYDKNNKVIRYILEYKEYSVYYNYNSFKKVFYRQLLACNIINGKMKYGLTDKLKEEDIVNIFGKYSWTQKYESNYIIMYVVDIVGSEQLQFSFDNDEKLSQIFIWVSN